MARGKIMNYLWTEVSVKNLEESISFYTELANLTVTRRFAAGTGVEIAFLGNQNKEGTQIELICNSAVPAVSQGEGVALGFAVESLDAMLSTVKSRGLPLHKGPVETPASRFFCVKDPDGLNVQFFELKKR